MKRGEPGPTLSPVVARFVKFFNPIDNVRANGNWPPTAINLSRVPSRWSCPAARVRPMFAERTASGLEGWSRNTRNRIYGKEETRQNRSLIFFVPRNFCIVRSDKRIVISFFLSFFLNSKISFSTKFIRKKGLIFRLTKFREFWVSVALNIGGNIFWKASGYDSLRRSLPIFLRSSQVSAVLRNTFSSISGVMPVSASSAPSRKFLVDL